jgi:hypothetical protein
MKFYSITDSGFIELINKSPELRETTFNTQMNITQKSINALIELAISKPKIQFVHRFCAITDEEVFKQIYDFTKYKIPNNLRLKGSKRAFIDSLFNTTIVTLSMDSDSDYSSSSDEDSETSDSSESDSSSESELFNSSPESELSHSSPESELSHSSPESESSHSSPESELSHSSPESELSDSSPESESDYSEDEHQIVIQL